MKKSIIITGPQGCGKTKNATFLLKKYNLSHLFDGWALNQKIPVNNCLILTNEPVENPYFGLKVIQYSEAIRGLYK